MINEFRKITKDYNKTVKQTKNKLIPYYIAYFLANFIEILLPIYIANITENLTNNRMKGALFCLSIFLLLKLLLYTSYYVIKHAYSAFFKHTYILFYQKTLTKIYQMDTTAKKKFSSGRIITSLTNDIINIGEMADNNITIILNLFKMMVLFFYFFKLNLFLTFLLLFINTLYIKRNQTLNTKIIHFSTLQRSENDKLISLINETINGLEDIQALGFANNLDKQFNKHYKNWQKFYDQKRKVQIYRETLLKGIIPLTKTIFYLYCIYALFNKQITIGTLLLVISYFDAFFKASEINMNTYASLKEQNISLQRINDFLSSEQIENLNTKETFQLGKIEFKNVVFSYTKEPFLTHLNFTILPNKITVITGDNGSGKTTLLNLIAGKLKPEKGDIEITDSNALPINFPHFVQNIGILNQESYLFHLSIKENFNLITKDSEKQQNICKLIGLEKWIQKLPKGYNTILDANATNLSGGQKRLLSLARTLLKDSPIFLLDETTSSFDQYKIKNFSKLITYLKKEHTIILVSHKKEIIKLADILIHIENGKTKTSNKKR